MGFGGLGSAVSKYGGTALDLQYTGGGFTAAGLLKGHGHGFDQQAYYKKYVLPYIAAQKAQQQAADKRNAATEATRQQQMHSLGAIYDDPRRQQYYDSLYGNALQSGLQPVIEQGMTDARNGIFNAADRGVLGGSSDLEKRTDVNRSVNAGALGAENSAFNFSHGIQQQDEAQRVNLQRLIQSADPAAQAALTSQLAGLNQGVQNQIQQNQSNTLSNQIKQYNQNSTSQLYGNGLGYAGTLYGIQQKALGAGGQGLFGTGNSNLNYGTVS